MFGPNKTTYLNPFMPGCAFGVPFCFTKWSDWDTLIEKVFIDVLAMHLHVQSCKSDHWLPSYGVDLIADFVRATLTLQFSPVQPGLWLKFKIELWKS